LPCWRYQPRTGVAENGPITQEYPCGVPLASKPLLLIVPVATVSDVVVEPSRVSTVARASQVKRSLRWVVPTSDLSTES
jgi:hypothetical protein